MNPGNWVVEPVEWFTFEPVDLTAGVAVFDFTDTPAPPDSGLGITPDTIDTDDDTDAAPWGVVEPTRVTNLDLHPDRTGWGWRTLATIETFGHGVLDALGVQ